MLSVSDVVTDSELIFLSESAYNIQEFSYHFVLFV